MKWKEISVLTTGNCVDAVAGVFSQMGAGGVQIEDPQAARTYSTSENSQALLMDPDFYRHEFVVVKAYFPEDSKVLNEMEQAVGRIEANMGSRCRFYVNEVSEEDWESSWKQYYHSFNVGRLLIKPSWEERPLKQGEVLVELDPGMAFGTGVHASTRFCLQFIDKYIEGGERVADAGCGSGILSIAAGRLGASSVHGWDIDELAVKIARENVRLNELDGIVSLETGDAVEKMGGRKYDVVLANITAELVVNLIPEAAKVLEPGGRLFGSGIVVGRWPAVQTRLEEAGFEIIEVLKDIDWIGVAARRVK